MRSLPLAPLLLATLITLVPMAPMSSAQDAPKPEAPPAAPPVAPPTAPPVAPPAAPPVAPPTAPPAAPPTAPPTAPPAAPEVPPSAPPAAPPTAPEVVAPAVPVELREALVIGGVSRGRRTPVRVDAIESAVVRGVFEPPVEGTEVALADGSRLAWVRANAAEDGFLRDEALRGGYAFFRVESDAPRAMLLEGTGHSMVYVNGQPRTGDPYQYGTTLLPIELKKGLNTFLFAVGRGVLRARLLPLPEPDHAWLDRRDLTLPDLLVASAVDTVAGVIVMNPTALPLRGAVIRSSLAGAAPIESAVPEIPPFALLKAAVRVVGPAPAAPGALPLSLSLLTHATAEGPQSEIAVELRAVDSNTMRRETFVSSIDGSAQYFAVQPASPAPDAKQAPGLILTLHGASVEASGQAAEYRRKAWAHVVAPTNRRPYGFDWEDWGRLDALEVLEIARQRLGTDPSRQWVTGHSMGGHGSWHLAVNHPELFAATAPSAGWVSFPAGGSDTDPSHPIGALFGRASLPSQTLRLRENLARMGVYVLHGDADDNVSVSNARLMRSELSQFHSDFAYHEQPGVGHWWGNECVDWPGLMDVLRRRALTPTASRSPLVFVTASPSVSARCDWALVDAQQVPFELSRLELSRDPGARRITGSTSNVARLRLDLAAAGFEADKPLALDLDGTALADVHWPPGGHLWLERDERGWHASSAPSPLQKNHVRGGPFKDGFRNRMIFVYGTIGSPEETTLLLGKARFDAETFWYRGNGAVEVIPDSAFNPAEHPDRNVILYGNAENNSVWNQLLRESPVQVRRGSVSIGSHTLVGEDLCCLFIRPRPDSSTATVTGVSGSGLVGMRLSERMPYFISGVGYPDVTVIGADMLERGIDGVRAAGFFGNDWTIESGDFAFAREGTITPTSTAATPSPPED